MTKALKKGAEEGIKEGNAARDCVQRWKEVLDQRRTEWITRYCGIEKALGSFGIGVEEQG